jgi:membrane protease YdiL (CAAX protease family)
MPQQILEACRRACAPHSRRQRAAGVVRATLSAAPLIGLALLAGAIAAAFGFTAPPSGFAVALTAITAPALALRGRHARGVYGLRWPRGTGWISAIPFAVVAGLAGGAWPAERAWMQEQGGGVAALAWLTAPVGAELLFRGLLHGRLVWEFGPTRIRRRGREPLSPPVLLSALLYAGTAAALGNLGSPLAAELPMLAPEPLAVCGAGVLGLAAGLARERSESVLAAIAVHASAAAALAAVTLLAVG